MFLNPAGPYLRHMCTDRYDPTLRHEAAHLQPAKTTWKHFSSVSSCVRTSLIKTSSVGPEGPKAVRFHPGRRCWQVFVHIHRRWQQVRFITTRHREIIGRDLNLPAWMDSNAFSGEIHLLVSPSTPREAGPHKSAPF